jgi:hypothetical protein
MNSGVFEMYRTTLLRILFMFITLMLVSGSVFAQEDTRSFEVPNQVFPNRINFTYNSQIAEDAVWQWIPASTDFQTPTGPVPESTEITFQNYSDDVGWVDSGQKIYVYPLVTFPVDRSYPFTQELTNLRAVLAARPNLPDSDLPMLPTVTAAQLLRTQVEFVDFPGGTGIRYVTAAGLDVSPLSDQVLFYTFQGLTSDEAYYIAAIFPVKSSILPAEAPQMTDDEYKQFAANYDTYLVDVTRQLNDLTPQAFTPDLTTIDHLFTTFQIRNPAATILTSPGISTGAAVYENVTFSYVAGLANRIEVDVIPPYTDPGGMSMFGSEPGYTTFSLFNYPVLRNYGYPAIRVIPVDTFPAADTRSDQQLALLKDFLAAHPTLSAQTAASGAAPIPVLPPINAAQVIVAKPVYLDFQSGTGVRFITFYSQGVNPITNDALVYSFIGMTANGKHIVSAEFPVTSAVLPDIDYTTFDVDAFAADYPNYVNKTLGELDGLDSQAYNPTLNVLDDVIRSINIGE